ncbi:hypothetical protein [Desulfonema ishimotonii]|uniref:hypothetical protein n=1 Tax=Desulfonema ishimotonii TaxID=45657 RepID=UPI000F582991|nr:hypothetical protein [Desulfonema ishimotonii]
MKRILFFLVLIAVWIQAYIQVSAAETIRMGYFDIKPHQYQTEITGRPQGATVRCFEKIARKMGYDVE